MRSIRLLAATTVILATAWSCGGSGSGVGPNTPVANFTVGACTAGTACQFTNTSTPTTGLTYAWNFGDNTFSTDASPAHTYVGAGDYGVVLTVKDASNATNTKTTKITVAAGTNQPPVASFALPTCTAGTPCGFHSTSTDADGTIAASHWDFGDGVTADVPDVTHTFAAAGSYNVALTVTDDKGGTNTATQAVTVSPAASQDCTTLSSGKSVDCSLTMTQKVTVKITLVSHSCELQGSNLSVSAPVAQTIFLNVCNHTDGESYTVQTAPNSGVPLVFQAGTALGIRFQQGTPGPNDPPTGDPGIRVSGSYPTWTLKVDDGGAAQKPGEPDFNDAILSVQATPAP